MNLTPKEYAEDLFLYYFELLPDGLYSELAARQEAKRFATKAAEEARKAELNVLVKFNITFILILLIAIALFFKYCKVIL